GGRQERKAQEDRAGSVRAKAARLTGTLAFATSDGPRHVLQSVLRAYSLQAVFSRDLAAAHAEGLIALAGLDYPAELGRVVVDPRLPPAGWLDLIDAPARTLVFDSPEYALTEEAAKPWAKNLDRFCAKTNRDAIVNLHTETPPAWMRAAEDGPLFGIPQSSGSHESAVSADWLIDELSRLDNSRIRIDWHLGADDFSSAAAAGLEPLSRRLGTRLCFVFDRPKRSVALGPGLD